MEKKKLKRLLRQHQLDSFQTFSKMPISINGPELDSDNKSSIDFRNLSRNSPETQEQQSLNSSERLEEQIMTTMLLKERSRPEKKVKEKKSQLISRPREVESTK